MGLIKRDIRNVCPGAEKNICKIENDNRVGCFLKIFNELMCLIYISSPILMDINSSILQS